MCLFVVIQLGYIQSWTQLGTARIEQWIRWYIHSHKPKNIQTQCLVLFCHFHSYFCCCCFLFFIFIYSCRLSSSMAKCTRFFAATSFVWPPLFYDCVLWTLWSIKLSKRPIEKIAQSHHEHIFENEEMPSVSYISEWFSASHTPYSNAYTCVFICM